MDTSQVLYVGVAIVAIILVPMISLLVHFQKSLRDEIKLTNNAIQATRTELKADIGTLGTDMTSMRTELKAEIGSSRAEHETIRNEMASMRAELKSEMASMQVDLKDEIKTLDKKIDGVRQQLLDLVIRLVPEAVAKPVAPSHSQPVGV